MNKKIVLDMDGVLADFEGAFCEQFGYDNRHEVKLENRYPDQSKNIRKFLSDPLVYASLRPLNLGLEICEWLNDNEFDVSIITSRPYGLEWITRRWLQKHKIKFLSFSLNPNKTGKIINMRPLCAIDDLISVYEALSRQNIPTIVISHPWNATSDIFMPRISNLDQFVSVLDRICTN